MKKLILCLLVFFSLCNVVQAKHLYCIQKTGPEAHYVNEPYVYIDLDTYKTNWTGGITSIDVYLTNAISNTIYGLYYSYVKFRFEYHQSTFWMIDYYLTSDVEVYNNNFDCILKGSVFPANDMPKNIIQNLKYWCRVNLFNLSLTNKNFDMYPYSELTTIIWN